MDRIYAACSAKLIIEIWSASHILWLLEESAQWACLAGISGPPVDDYASAGPCWWWRGVYQRSKNCQSALPVIVWVHPAVSWDCSTPRTWLLDTLLKEQSKHGSSVTRFTPPRRCHVRVKVWKHIRWPIFKAAARWELSNHLGVKQLRIRTQENKNANWTRWPFNCVAKKRHSGLFECKVLAPNFKLTLFSSAVTALCCSS